MSIQVPGRQAIKAGYKRMCGAKGEAVKKAVYRKELAWVGGERREQVWVHS